MHKIVCGLQIAAQASGSFIKSFKSSVSNLDSLSDVAAFTLLHRAFSHLYALTCKHQTGKKVHNKFSNVIYQNVYFLRTLSFSGRLPSRSLRSFESFYRCNTLT